MTGALSHVHHLDGASVFTRASPLPEVGLTSAIALPQAPSRRSGQPEQADNR
jgi:hypothetical protein